MAKNKLFLLLGPEKGQKDQFISNIRQALKKKMGEEPESHRFYPFDSDMSNILSILRNGSLFSAHKLAIINNAEELKKAGEIKLLGQFCSNMPEDVTLILISDGISIDKRIEKLVPAAQKKIFWRCSITRKKAGSSSFFPIRE